MSRSLDDRPRLEAQPLLKGSAALGVKPKVVPVAQKYTTASALNVRTAPAGGAKVLTELTRGTKVAVTGMNAGKWAQIVFKGESRWVTAKYLSEDDPEPAISAAPCASGSAAESGLRPDTVKVHRAVCAQFPAISSYGGLGGGGAHSTGRALDIMTSDKATGDRIAAYLQQHAAALGVSQLIWRQRIWTVQRSGDGWRSMSDRGSATANHMDHVHVTTYGNAAR